MAVSVKNSARMLLWTRIVGGILTGLLALDVILVAKQEIGIEPAWWFLIFGTAPSILVLLCLLLRRLVIAYKLALTHDALLLIGFLLLLVVLPNFLGLVIMSPLGIFIVEGIVLFRRRKNLLQPPVLP